MRRNGRGEKDNTETFWNLTEIVLVSYSHNSTDIVERTNTTDNIERTNVGVAWKI